MYIAPIHTNNHYNIWKKPQKSQDTVVVYKRTGIEKRRMTKSIWEAPEQPKCLSLKSKLEAQMQ